MRCAPEHAEAVALVRWAKMQEAALPPLRELFAIPNGGARKPATAAALQAEGVRPGIPDYMLPHLAAGWPGLFVELKRRDGGELSTYQRDRIQRLAAAGYAVAIAAGWEQAAEVLRSYIAGQWTEARQLNELDKIPKPRRSARAA